MFSARNERLALLLSTIIFAIVGLFQFFRFFTHMAVTVGGHHIPTWPSLIIGAVLLFMAFWLGGFAKLGSKHS